MEQIDNGIEIILRGTRALDYINNQKIADSNLQVYLDRITMLESTITKADSYIEALVKEVKSLKVTKDTNTENPINHRVERDKKLAKDTMFKEKVNNAFTPTKPKNTKWQQWELDKLDTAIQSTQPSKNNLAWLVHQFPNRTESSIRSKLNTLGVTVKKDKLIIK